MLEAKKGLGIKPESLWGVRLEMGLESAENHLWAVRGGRKEE
jgi:hypothetical protein